MSQEEKSDANRVIAIGYLIILWVAVLFYGAVDDWIAFGISVLICLLTALRGVFILIKGAVDVKSRLFLVPLILVWLTAFCQRFGIGLSTADRYATENFLIVFGALILSFDAALEIVVDRRVRRLLALSVIGIAVATGLLGASVDILRSVYPEVINDWFAVNGYAQFVNRNHCAYVVELSLGLLLGYGLFGTGGEFRRFLAWSGIAFLGWVTIAVNSRGALVSIGLMILLVAAYRLLQGEGRERSRILQSTIGRYAATFGLILALVSAGIFVIAYVGGERLAGRIERIDDELKGATARSVERGKIWESTVALIKEKPVFGHGFGAFGVSITRHDVTNGRYRLEQAHNDYLELAANGGIWSCLIGVCWFGMLFANGVPKLRRSASEERWLVIGALLGIVGVLIHSLVDFGLHGFGVATLFLTVSAIVVGVPARKSKVR